MRTFIAIELPDEIKNFLAGIQRELKLTGADVKWVEPKNIHLTLKFLGEIEEEVAQKVGEIFKEIAQNFTLFSLTLSEIGAFPKLQYPRVIWIGLNQDQEVAKIAEELEKRLNEIGIPQESRAFSSHITLGRVRTPKNRSNLIDKINYLNNNFPSPKPEFKVKQIILFKSTLKPTGPIYEPIFAANLQVI